MKKNITLMIIGLVLIGVGIVAYVLKPNQAVAPNIPNAPVGATSTLQGIYVCLPHKDTSGPQTLECALGMKADNGFYYSLDTQDISPSPVTTPTNTRISVTGFVVPVEALSSDEWQKYDIKGVMKVEVFKTL